MWQPPANPGQAGVRFLHRSVQLGWQVVGAIPTRFVRQQGVPDELLPLRFQPAFFAIHQSLLPQTGGQPLLRSPGKDYPGLPIAVPGVPQLVLQDTASARYSASRFHSPVAPSGPGQFPPEPLAFDGHKRWETRMIARRPGHKTPQ